MKPIRHLSVASTLAVAAAIWAPTPTPADEAAPQEHTGSGAPPAAPALSPAPPAPAPDDGRSHRRNVRVELPIDVEVHGRIYMGISADQRESWERQLGLDEARLSVVARVPHVLTEVEADLASRTMIKDAYVRVDAPAALRFTAGRFKAPFLARELESSWKLPIVGRGLVDDYLVSLNGLGGRRLGAMAEFRPFAGRVEIAGGTFVGDPTALSGTTARAQDYAGSVAVKPFGKHLEVGVTAYVAAAPSGPGVPEGLPRKDGTSTYAAVAFGPLSADVEGSAGRVEDGTFRAGTALVGWTFTLGHARQLRITPIAGAEAIEVRGDTRAVGQSAIAGAVLGWSDGLKVRVQGERARRPGDDVPKNAVALQVATRF